MNAMHPKKILAHYDLAPKRSLGQNFLFDENVLAQIVNAAAVDEQDEILEIGPGLGSLSRQLAKRARRVVAVELDDRFLPILHTELVDFENVEILHGDILDQNLAQLFAGTYKVVANVPYYITGAILRYLLGGDHKPFTIVLTVQKEVAERITAVPPQMSLLAVSVQYYGQARVIRTVKAGAFWPRPEVDSAVVQIDLDSSTLFNPAMETKFFRIVRAGFSQKRKQLQKNLRQLWLNKGEVSALLARAGIDGSRRAQTLSLDEWRAVTREF